VKVTDINKFISLKYFVICVIILRQKFRSTNNIHSFRNATKIVTNIGKWDVIIYLKIELRSLYHIILILLVA